MQYKDCWLLEPLFSLDPWVTPRLTAHHASLRRFQVLTSIQRTAQWSHSCPIDWGLQSWEFIDTTYMALLPRTAFSAPYTWRLTYVIGSNDGGGDGGGSDGDGVGRGSDTHLDPEVR